MKQEFKRIISWNKDKSEITTETKNNNLDYLKETTFRNINRLFVLSFKNGNDDPIRNSLDEYYMSLVKIRDFNSLIHDKTFLDEPEKTNKKHLKNYGNVKEIMIIQPEIY